MLLDEPAAGLNHTETGEIEALIRKVAQSGVTVVLVEHDMKLVMNLSDHILVLDYGKNWPKGTPPKCAPTPTWSPPIWERQHEEMEDSNTAGLD